jgi:putative SOS response-associated peptidase YedK
MCGGIEAKDKNRAYEPVRVYFPNPKAAFPVMLEDGTDLGWLPWGRRKEQPGSGPQGGWARQESLENGSWAKYRPQRAFGLISRYMEKDAERVSHWFDVEDGQVLECVVTGEPGDQCVYVVTASSPLQFSAIHDRWPLIAHIPGDGLTAAY